MKFLFKKISDHEPYRPLFVIGFLMSLIGVSYWVLYSAGAIHAYPIHMHAHLMVIGFLLAFVSGFLMTAVPRMTSTQSATRPEKFLVILLFITFLVANTLSFKIVEITSAVVIFVFLIIYFLKRKMSSKLLKLPSGFIFIPIALLSGLMGLLLSLIAEYGFPQLLIISKLLLYEAFVFNLIIGLGSRLVPILTKKVNAINPAEMHQIQNKVFIIQAVIFNMSFWIEAYVNFRFGVFLRLLIVSYVVVNNFQLLKPRVEKSYLGIGIMISTISMPLSYIFILIFPGLRSQLIHILYILGFAMLTYLISVRVSLAHGGGSLSLEKTTRLIPTFVILFIGALIFRVLGYFYLNYQMLLFYLLSGLCFISAAIIWASLLKKFYLSKSIENEKC